MPLPSSGNAGRSPRTGLLPDTNLLPPPRHFPAQATLLSGRSRQMNHSATSIAKTSHNLHKKPTSIMQSNNTESHGFTSKSALDRYTTSQITNNIYTILIKKIGTLKGNHRLINTLTRACLYIKIQSNT